MVNPSASAAVAAAPPAPTASVPAAPGSTGSGSGVAGRSNIHWLDKPTRDPAPELDAAWARAMAMRYGAAGGLAAQPTAFGGIQRPGAPRLCARCALRRQSLRQPRTADSTLPQRGPSRPGLHAIVSDPDAFGCRAAGAGAAPWEGAGAGRRACCGAPLAQPAPSWLPRAASLRALSVAHDPPCAHCALDAGAAGPLEQRWLAAPGDALWWRTRQAALLPLPAPPPAGELEADRPSSPWRARAAPPPLRPLHAPPLPPAPGADADGKPLPERALAELAEHPGDGSGDAKIDSTKVEDKSENERYNVDVELTIKEIQEEPGIQERHALIISCTNSGINPKSGEDDQEKIESCAIATVCEITKDEEDNQKNLGGNITDEEQKHKDENSSEDTGDSVDACTQYDIPSKKTRKHRSKGSNGSVKTVGSSSTSSSSSSSDSSSDSSSSSSSTSSSSDSDSSSDSSSNSSSSSSSSSSSDSSDTTSTTQTTSSRVSAWVRRGADASDCLWGYWSDGGRGAALGSSLSVVSDASAVVAAAATAAGAEPCTPTRPQAADEHSSTSASSSSSDPSDEYPKLIAPPSSPYDGSSSTSTVTRRSRSAGRAAAVGGVNGAPGGEECAPAGTALGLPASKARRRHSLHISIPGMSGDRQRTAPAPGTRDGAAAPAHAHAPARRFGARPLARGERGGAGASVGAGFGRRSNAPAACTARIPPPRRGAPANARLGTGVAARPAAASPAPVSPVYRLNVAAAAAAKPSAAAGGGAGWQRGAPRCAGDRTAWSHRSAPRHAPEVA